MPNLDESNEHKSRILTFVSKAFHLNVTFRSDISSNTDIQVLNVSELNIDFLILNVYNERNQKLNSNKYIIERKFVSINLFENSIICDDFNAYHQ